jgi:hypothetical protein
MPKKPKRKMKRKAKAKRAPYLRMYQSGQFWHWQEPGQEPRLGTLDDMLPPEQTINRVPKVEWS